MGYIYKIINNINNKVYIGQTSKKRANDRWSQHKSDSKHLREGDNSALHLAMNKYGIENFCFKILEEVDISLLDEREKYWISFYDSKVPNGYNISEGGNVPRGIPNKYKGVPRTEEVKQKIRDSWTNERKKQYSIMFSGKNNPMYGKKVSDETKKKISEKLSGELNPFYGKHHTEETKQKLSQYQQSKKKAIGMYDKETGELLKSFESISAAGRYIDGDTSYISKACRRKTQTGSNIAYGYAWNFIESV